MKVEEEEDDIGEIPNFKLVLEPLLEPFNYFHSPQIAKQQKQSKRIAKENNPNIK